MSFCNNCNNPLKYCKCQEFNLKEKRKELFEKIEKFYPYLKLTIIEDQDKEFIRLLKEEFEVGKEYNKFEIITKIDKLTGELK